MRWTVSNVLIVLIGLAALVAGSTGCDKATPVAPSPSRALSVLCVDGMIPPEPVDAFQGDTHVAVKFAGVARLHDLEARVAHGDFARNDVVLLPEQVAAALAKQSNLAKLDPASCPNLSKVAPEYKSSSFGGPESAFAAPFVSIALGIIYNPEKVTDAPITGFKDLFRPALAGRIIVPDDARVLASCAMLANAIDVNDPSPANLDKIRPALVEWGKLIAKYDSSDAAADAVRSGAADAAIVTAAQAGKVLAGQSKLKWVSPAEGTVREVFCLAIPSTATANKALAEQFISGCLSAGAGRALMERSMGQSCNVDAGKLMSAEEQKDSAMPVTPPNAKTLHEITPEQSAAIEQLVQQARAGK